MRHCIVYCSPNGSTRHVAEVIAERLAALGHSVDLFDLGKDAQQVEGRYRRIPAPKCLWVGSPVYVNHNAPPVERFLRSLQGGRQCYAVPFVTWGAVNSGVALIEMAEMLTQTDHILLGGAKVVAVHSMMWSSADPLGGGHPDAEDDSLVQRLVDSVHEKLALPEPAGLSLDVLDYQPESVKEDSKGKSIAVAKQHFPELVLNAERCTRCGQCAEQCPSEAITLNPYPVFGEECILCLKCVRECPEDAIPLDMSVTEARIRSMARSRCENPPSTIFV
jgi:ferredoxin